MLQSLEAIGEKCRKTARMSRVEDVRKTVRDYLSEVEAFRNIASWADPNDASDVSDVSFGSDGIQLQNLVSQVEELDIKETRKRWEDLEWKVEEPSDMLVLFHGHETRIEQVSSALVSLSPHSSYVAFPLYFSCSSGASSGTDCQLYRLGRR